MSTAIDKTFGRALAATLLLAGGTLQGTATATAAALDGVAPHDWGIVEAAAATAPPVEHAGLTLETLGVVPATSMQATVGLEGHRLQLRAITIAPGGQIAVHSHATRPGLVKVVAGEWIEGRAGGETVFDAESAANVEDELTEHWFYNRGDQPATALVCDLVPEG